MFVSQQEIENWFSYHKPTEVQTVKYEQIREAAKKMAEVINQHCPDGGDKLEAFRKVREAVMTANSAIACHRQW